MSICQNPILAARHNSLNSPKHGFGQIPLQPFMLCLLSSFWDRQSVFLCISHLVFQMIQLVSQHSSRDLFCAVSFTKMCRVCHGTRPKRPYGSGGTLNLELIPPMSFFPLFTPAVTPAIHAFIIRCVVDVILRHFCSVAIHFRKHANVLAMRGLRFSAIT